MVTLPSLKSLPRGTGTNQHSERLSKTRQNPYQRLLTYGQLTGRRPSTNSRQRSPRPQQTPRDIPQVHSMAKTIARGNLMSMFECTEQTQSECQLRCMYNNKAVVGRLLSLRFTNHDEYKIHHGCTYQGLLIEENTSKDRFYLYIFVKKDTSEDQTSLSLTLVDNQYPRGYLNQVPMLHTTFILHFPWLTETSGAFLFIHIQEHKY